MKLKKLNIFVRFGGLNLKTQKGFNKSDSYHSPPASKGFFAFPLLAQEFFLIGSMDVFQPGIIPKWKSIPGKTYEDIDYELFEKKRKKAVSAMRKQFVKNEGNIWHHLVNYTDRSEIIEENGSWCKTSIKAWQRAFMKMSLKHRYHIGDKWSEPVKSINETKGLLGWYSKDHCEVFFDEKVS